MSAVEDLRADQKGDHADSPKVQETGPKPLSEQSEVLLRYHQDYGQRACHYESQRATVGHIIVLGTVGLIGLIGPLEHQDWPLTVCIVLIGFFGTVFTCVYDGLVRRCEQRRKQYFWRLNQLLFAGQSPIELSNKHPARLNWLHLVVVKFWPLAIFLIALVFTIYTIKLPASEGHELTISFK